MEGMPCVGVRVLVVVREMKDGYASPSAVYYIMLSHALSKYIQPLIS